MRDSLNQTKRELKFQRGVAAAEIPWCADHGTGVIAYSPMMSGLLTGRFSRERMASLDEGDWRRGFPEFQEPALSRNLALQDGLAADRRSSRRVGRRRRGRLDARVARGDRGDRGRPQPGPGGGVDRRAGLVLTDDDLDAIAAAIASTGAGRGPVRPPGLPG